MKNWWMFMLKKLFSIRRKDYIRPIYIYILRRPKWLHHQKFIQFRSLARGKVKINFHCFRPMGRRGGRRLISSIKQASCRIHSPVSCRAYFSARCSIATWESWRYWRKSLRRWACVSSWWILAGFPPCPLSLPI